MKVKPEEELRTIAAALKAAETYTLEPEVVWSAMRYLQENPGTSISEALTHGLVEWDI